MKILNITLRNFILIDIESLATLTTELGYPTTIEDMTSRMSEILQQPNSKTIVAELHGQIVGFMGMSKNLSWESNNCSLRIQALVVSEEYRKLGVGKALIDFAESYAKEIKAKSLILNCGNRYDREIAHRFYTALGFEAKTTGYRKEID